MIIAILAFARATIWAFEALADRSEMELSESKPTAITVSRIHVGLYFEYDTRELWLVRVDDAL